MNIDKIKQKYKPEMENLILILTEIQESNPRHYVTNEDMEWVAGYLNITLSAVYGVVTYYSMFSTKPRGRYVIRVCRSPVCDMVGGSDVFKALETILGIKEGEATEDGLFFLEGVECLGQCDKAPSMMINETVYGCLTDEKIRSVVTALRRDPSNGG